MSISYLISNSYVILFLPVRKKCYPVKKFYSGKKLPMDVQQIIQWSEAKEIRGITNENTIDSRGK